MNMKQKVRRRSKKIQSAEESTRTTYMGGRELGFLRVFVSQDVADGYEQLLVGLLRGLGQRGDESIRHSSNRKDARHV